MEQKRRRKEHQRSPDLEALLDELNTIAEVGAAHQGVWDQQPLHPPVFLVGCPRAGTTLFMQWLAASRRFAYPSNLASRLFRSPRMGALLHRALLDFDTREEIVPAAQQTVSFSSVLGKTKGAVQPHEYWYFWRRFFHFGEIHQLEQADLEAVNAARFAHESGRLKVQ